MNLMGLMSMPRLQVGELVCEHENDVRCNDELRANFARPLARLVGPLKDIME